jgi:hypothetical protein
MAASNKRPLELFDSLPVPKRANFDAQPILQQIRFLLEQLNLYQEYKIEYELSKDFSIFGLFKRYCDETATKDIAVLSAFPFDTITIESLISLRQHPVYWNITLNARDKVLKDMYKDSLLDLDYFEDIKFPVYPLVVKYRDLDYLVTMVEACREHIEQTAPAQPEPITNHELGRFLSNILKE